MLAGTSARAALRATSVGAAAGAGFAACSAGGSGGGRASAQARNSVRMAMDGIRIRPPFRSKASEASDQGRLFEVKPFLRLSEDARGSQATGDVPRHFV